VGGVWRDAYEFNADNLASSTGVGLRLDMPGFPIRIDRAWDVEADDELTDTDNWVIWIGYDY
jgi:outer membrane protein assembly factor BamA